MRRCSAMLLLLLLVPPPPCMASTLDEALYQAPKEWPGLTESEGVEESAAVQEALEARVDYSVWGVPRTINALARPLAFLGAAPEKGAGASVAQQFFGHFPSDFAVFDWAHIEFEQISQDVSPLGWTVYRVSQVMDGVPVRNSDMVLHVDQNGALRYFHGNFYSDLFAEPLDFVMQYEEALAKAKANLSAGEEVLGMELEYIDTTISGIGPQALKPMWVVYASGRMLQLDGVTGLLVNEEQMDAFALQTSLIDVQNYKKLTGRTMTNATISGYLGQIYNKWGTWGWTSYDNADSPMRVYDDYCFCDMANDNDCYAPVGDCGCDTDGPDASCPGLLENEVQLAFWHGGSEATNFGSQAGALGSGPYGPGAVVLEGNATLDLLAHEFAHGFNQNTAALVYEHESGALAEGFADCFAAMVDTSNWTVLESSAFATLYGSSTVRSLADPTQTSLTPPGYMTSYSACSNAYPNYGYQADSFLLKSSVGKGMDFGAVHENSGIIGKACWLLGDASTHSFGGKTVVGQGRTATGYVFHYAQRQYLTSTSQFIDARSALITAGFLYDVSQGDSGLTMTNQTANAMDAVGIWSSSGNVGGSLKNTTARMIAAVEQAVGTSYRRFLFFRNAATSRLKYFQYIPGTGWSKLDLPTYKYMADISPVAVTTYIWDDEETSVFYQTTNNVLTRVRIRDGVVAQPVATENLEITTAHQVGGAQAHVEDGAYGIAYRQGDGKVHVKYLRYLPGYPDEALLPIGDYQVRVGPWPGTDLESFTGLSMTRGDGRVWLAYLSRLYDNGNVKPDKLCVTHISDTAFACNFTGTRLWSTPVCFDPPDGCRTAFAPPLHEAWSLKDGPTIFAYTPNPASPVRYYVAYPQDDAVASGQDRSPVMITFQWNSGSGIVGPTRPVLVSKSTSVEYPVAGGFLKDSLGNMRFYYTDTTQYIAELLKYGY